MTLCLAPFRPVLLAGAVALAATAVAVPGSAQTPEPPADPSAPALENRNVDEAFALLAPEFERRKQALAYFSERGDPDAIPALIQALRFIRADRPSFYDALTELAGENPGDSWHDWMLWQQAHPEIRPFDGFISFKAGLYSEIDADFRLFLYENVKHEIRIEEITWGGVRKDGIPALTNPTLITPEAADYLTNDELVFGVEINGDARAYPLRIMDWHEMFNDVIGGVPVSLAYCTLCGSGILFETAVPGRGDPFVFGSSGFLYRSNKLMYDTETHSLWNQFTGRPVVGPLTGSGLELNTRPVAITTWAKWRAKHPETRVLSLETGHERDYTPGRPYGSYFASSELMFPALVDESQLKAKDYVFALRSSGHERAWPLSLFETRPVINDRAGAVFVTLIGDSDSRTVRAYRTEGQAFTPGDTPEAVALDGAQWRIEEQALVGPDGREAPRLPGHIAYWFAWSGYFGDQGSVAE